jgi:hypothetical protein
MVTIRGYARGELRLINSIEPDPMPDWVEVIEAYAGDIVSIEVDGKLAGVAALVGREVVASMDRTMMRGHSKELVEACRVRLDEWGIGLWASCGKGDRHSAVWLKALGFIPDGEDATDFLFAR